MRGDSKVRDQPLCDQDQLLLFTELSDVPKSTQGFSSRFVVGCVVRAANSIAYCGGCESAQRHMLRFSNGVLKGIVSGADDDGRAETVVALPLSPALRVRLAMRWSFPITPFVHNGPLARNRPLLRNAGKPSKWLVFVPEDVREPSQCTSHELESDHCSNLSRPCCPICLNIASFRES
jgi:hypothetical protein